MFKNLNLDKTISVFTYIILAFLIAINSCFGGNTVIIVSYLCSYGLFSGNYKSKFDSNH